jgi:DNA processing protein
MNFSYMPRTSGAVGRQQAAGRYSPPMARDSISLSALLAKCRRDQLATKQLDMLRRGDVSSGKDITIRFAGDLGVLDAPCVSIVGTREASERGLQRASWLSTKLAEAGFTIVSGLAKGVDTAAHTGAIAANGKTVAVIGTPLNKAYPIENAALQEIIYRDHLLLTPFEDGEVVYRSNFPKRNRVMAAVSDATVIIEASDTSGTLHQAAECTQLKRWLFISQAIIDNPELKWPQKFLNYERVVVLQRVSEIIDRVHR